ncbi:MAG: hypothetical protein IKJ27_00130 [Clostridia bacterium]|nr:hypothetical protein [Clostridia bacterium]
MSKAALTSINPPHTNNIFSGLKGIEWRTKPMPTGKHYCYETKKCFGVGKVIGEFRIWRVVRYENISTIPEGYISSGCVPIEFLEAYSKGRPIYANFIKSPVKYDKPKELSEYKKINRECWYAYLGLAKRDCPECQNKGCFIQRPPQSWCYVEELEDI